MKILYVLLFALLLFFLFHTLVTHYLPKKFPAQLQRIKMKVLYYEFSAPIIIGLVISFVLLIGFEESRIYGPLGAFTGSLLRPFFGIRRYFTKIKLTDSFLEVSYLTTLFKPKLYRFNVSEVKDVEIEKNDWSVDCPAKLAVANNMRWTKFYLVDKKLIVAIREDIAAVNMRLSAMALPVQDAVDLSATQTN